MIGHVNRGYEKKASELFSNMRNGVNVFNMELLPSINPYRRGILWDLASALNYIETINIIKKAIFLIFKPSSKIQPCIDVLAEFFWLILNMFLPEDDHRHSGSFNTQNGYRGLSGSKEL